MVRQWTVTPSVAGSIPVVRPENDVIFHVFINVHGVLSTINDFLNEAFYESSFFCKKDVP